MITPLLLTLAAYEVTPSQLTAPAPHIERQEYRVSFGEQPFEEFKAVHVSAPWSWRTMLLSVPLGFQAQWYEGAEWYGTSIPGILAYFGVDLWIVEMRTPTEETLPVGSCPTPFDCPELGQWGLPDLLADLDFVAELSGSEAPMIAGHWTGGMLASAAVSTKPDNWSAMILLDGTLHTDEPVTLERTGAICGLLSSLPISSGADVLAEIDLLQAAEAGDPEAIAQLEYLFTTADPLPDRISDGLRFMTPDEDGHPLHSDLEQLYRINAEWNPTYTPMGPFRDLACSFGDLPGLADFEGKALLMCGGLDQECWDTADALVNADVTTDIDPELGVNDYVFSPSVSPWVAFRMALFAWGMGG